MSTDRAAILARLNDEQVRVLAKVRCAEHLGRRIEGPIPSAVSRLAHGRYSRAAYDACVQIGLVRWNNGSGSVLTDLGGKLLADLLADGGPS